MNNPSDLSTRRALLAVLLLIVAMGAVYGRVYGHKFLIWDDDKHVVENPHLSPVTWRGLRQFWQRPYLGLYIPLSYTFFAAEATIARQQLPDGMDGGPNPLVFHLGNLALHCACVLLVFTILRRLVRHDGAACAGALLFGLHPVQVESVAWVSETRGVLCALFSLLAVWQYLRYAETSACRWRLQSPIGSIGDASATGIVSPSATGIVSPSATGVASYSVATVCFVLALLCKPAAVAVPLIAGALDLGLLRRPVRRVLLGIGFWLVIAAGCVVVTKLQQPNRQLPSVSDPWARPLLAGDALAFYLVKLVVPLRLGPDYGRNPEWVMQQWSFYCAWLLPVAGLIVLAVSRNRRVWLTSAAIFLVWVLPVLGFVPFVFQRISTVADRYLYLALLGPALALSWLLARYWNRWTITVSATILSLLGILSCIQTGYWRDDYTLIDRGLRVNRRSAVARQHRTHLLAREGRQKEAIAEYREALKDHPRIAELHLGLAASLIALNETEEAVRVLQEAVRQLPGEPILRCELGNALAREGMVDEAVLEYRQALGIDPRCARAHVAWGELLWQRGASEEAIQHFRDALHVNPNHVPAHINLGVALYTSREVYEARYHYEAALEIRPDDAAAHYNLANLLLAEGAMAEAMDHYRAALRIDPAYAEAQVNLAAALLEQGHAREAIRHCRAALRLKPELVEGHVHLGRALAAEGRPEEAASAFRAALRLVPPDSRKARQIRALLPSTSAGAAEWKSLFDGKTLGDWKVVGEFDFRNHGQVEVKDGTLVLGKGRPGTAIRYSGKFPKRDYEISLEAMRVDGDDFFCGMTFPVGESPLTLIVGGWGGPVVGLSCIDDEPAVENETCQYMEFKQKQWYKIRLRVTGWKIEAWIDEEKLVDLETKNRKLTIWFEPETALPLGIATWRTTGALRNLRVRTLETNKKSHK